MILPTNDECRIMSKIVQRHNYMLLSRLQSDCEYFVGEYGTGSERHLWAGNVEDQIAKMKELYDSFADDLKPEWLTIEQICDYETRMLEIKAKKLSE